MAARSRFQSHNERGKQFLAAGNIDKADIEFRNALQMSRTAPRRSTSTAESPSAWGCLREALELYPAAFDARPNDSRARGASLAKLFVLGSATRRALEVISPGLLDHPE